MSAKPVTRQYRVEVAYRFRSERPGVLLGATVEAENEDIAMDRAIAQYVTPYKARVLLSVMVAEKRT